MLLEDQSQKHAVEVRNQATLVSYISDFHQNYDGRDPFTVAVVCDMHTITVDGIYGCGGRIRGHTTDEVRVEGASFNPASPADVLLELPNILSKIADWKNGTKPDRYPSSYPESASDYNRFRPTTLFYDFEILHPFRGGNGRVGRALLHLALYELGILAPPQNLFSYMRIRRERYFECLHIADDGDLSQLDFYISRGIRQVRYLSVVQRIAQLDSQSWASFVKTLTEEQQIFLDMHAQSALDDETESQQFDVSLELVTAYLAQLMGQR